MDKSMVACFFWLTVYIGTRALTYLLTYTVYRAYKADNISETVEDSAKSTNDLHKIVRGLSIAAKMYDLEWPMSEIQGHCFFKFRKNGEIQLSNDSHAMWSGWMHYIY